MHLRGMGGYLEMNRISEGGDGTVDSHVLADVEKGGTPAVV